MPDAAVPQAVVLVIVPKQQALDRQFDVCCLVSCAQAGLVIQGCQRAWAVA